ncbi:MAG: hypothetical protein IJT77_00390 [Clostridia bacterium]|nr:hypothetical protein [Clostridia bacterium]
MTTISVILIVTCCFLAAILNLALQSRFKNRVMGICAASAVVLGILFYSYAYTFEGGFTAITILKSLLTICRMFGGVNDYAAVAATPLIRYPLVMTIFWVGHFAAFYVTASAAIEIIGKRVLKIVRMGLLRKGSLTIIYGDTAEAIQLGKRFGKSSSLIFVVDEESATTASIVESLSGVVFSGGATLCATPEFLRTIGMGKKDRQLDIYCMSSDHAQNYRYAAALMEALSELQVNPDMTSLFLLDVPEEKATGLIAYGDHYGYGYLFACEKYDLIARLLIRRLPPWTLLRMDGNGRALNDLNVIIIGFGQMGRAVLRQLIMNGQMEGSTFHAEIYDRQMRDLSGYVEARYPALLKAYDIRFNSNDARSAAFYRRLQDEPASLIVICTNNRQTNEELALDIEHWYAIRENKPPVVRCTTDSIIINDDEYRLGDIDVRAMDRTAMILNHGYTNGPSEEIDWRNCDAFSRASSRASADFYPAILYASGIPKDDALNGKWPPSPEVLENLAKSEHRRWNAFHLAMGYQPMNSSEYEERAKRYLSGESVRVAKSTSAQTHACLVPWEELDALSARESEIYGRHIDYKIADRNNVLAIPDIIRKERNNSIGKK